MMLPAFSLCLLLLLQPTASRAKLSRDLNTGAQLEYKGATLFLTSRSDQENI